MTIIKILGLVLLAVFVEVAFVPAKAVSDDVIKVAVIDALSGPFADRGKRATDLYKEYFAATNAAGGVSVGQRKYKIHTPRKTRL